MGITTTNKWKLPKMAKKKKKRRKKMMVKHQKLLNGVKNWSKKMSQLILTTVVDMKRKKPKIVMMIMPQNTTGSNPNLHKNNPKRLVLSVLFTQVKHPTTMLMVEVPPDTRHTLYTTEKMVVCSTTTRHPVEMVVCLVVLSSVSSFFLSVLLEVPLHSSRRSLEVMLIRRNHLSMKKVPWPKKFIYKFIYK